MAPLSTHLVLHEIVLTIHVCPWPMTIMLNCTCSYYLLMDMNVGGWCVLSVIVVIIAVIL